MFLKAGYELLHCLDNRDYALYLPFVHLCQGVYVFEKLYLLNGWGSLNSIHQCREAF